MKRDGVVAGKLDAQRMRARAAYKTCMMRRELNFFWFICERSRQMIFLLSCFVCTRRRYKNKTI